MATRLILHGGNAHKRTDKNDMFFDEIISGVNRETIRVFCIYFARPEHRWENS